MNAPRGSGRTGPFQALRRLRPLLLLALAGPASALASTAQPADRAAASAPVTAGARPDVAALHWQGGESELAAPLQVAVTDQEAWSSLWRRALGRPAPPVDFGRYFVACVFLGQDTDWPYDISFGAPVVEGSRLVVPFSLVMLRLEVDPAAPRGLRRRGQYAMRAFPRRGALEIVLRGDSPDGPVPGIDPPAPAPPRQPSWAEDFRVFDARPLAISYLVANREFYAGTFLVAGTRPKADRPAAGGRPFFGAAPGPGDWVLEDDTGAIRVRGVPAPEPGRPVVLAASFGAPGTGPLLRGLRLVTAAPARGTVVVHVGEFVRLPLASTKSSSSHLELSGDLASIEAAAFLNAEIVLGVRPGTVTGNIVTTWWNRPEPERRGEVVLQVVAR